MDEIINMLWFVLFVVIFLLFRGVGHKSCAIVERKCARCGSIFDLQVHHKIPLSLGGKDIAENREILCRTCHEMHHGYKFGDTYEKRDALSVKNRSKKTDILNKAIEAGSDVYIVYSVNTVLYKEKTTRVIHPICLFEQNRRIYVKAFCYLKNAERTFRVSRIQSISLVKIKI